MLITITHIEQALMLPDFDGFQAQMGMAPAGRERMKPSPDNPPRQSAVLVLLYPETDGTLSLILTKRTEHLSGHSGQVSFPGGRCDDDDDSFEDTALRETCEEIGVCDRSQIRILGRLTGIWIPPGNHDVVPVVATIDHQPQLTLSPSEVAHVLYLSLSDLMDDTIKKTTPMTFREQIFDVPYYDVQGHIVWGATAAMLGELESRIKIVLKQQA